MITCKRMKGNHYILPYKKGNLGWSDSVVGKASALPQPTRVQSPEPHRVLRTLSGVIPQHRARGQPWAVLGVASKQNNKIELLTKQTIPLLVFTQKRVNICFDRPVSSLASRALPSALLWLLCPVVSRGVAGMQFRAPGCKGCVQPSERSLHPENSIWYFF